MANDAYDPDESRKTKLIEGFIEEEED